MNGTDGLDQLLLAEAADRTTKVTGKSIRQLAKTQKYKCALTGWDLTPETASLDHIYPIGKGGEHCMENIHIVHMNVNHAKGSLTQTEFIELCTAIVEYQKQKPIQ